MQAAAYNTKYGFDRLETRSYEEVTEPLRRLLIKDATYGMMDSETHRALH